MDPKATLIAADQAVSDDEHEAALGHLNDYEQWRLKGGFEPAACAAYPRGDVFRLEIARRCLDEMNQRAARIAWGSE